MKCRHLSLMILILFVLINEDGVAVTAASGKITPYFGDVAVTTANESKAWNIAPPSGGGGYIFALKFSRLDISINDDIWMPDGQRLPTNSVATINRPLCFMYEVGQGKGKFNCNLARNQTCPDAKLVGVSTLRNFNLTFRNDNSRIRFSFMYRMCQNECRMRMKSPGGLNDTSIALLCLTVFMLVLLIVVFVLFVRNKQTLIRLKMTQNQSQVDKSTTNNSGNSSSAQQMETPRSNQTSDPDAQFSKVEKAQLVDNVIYQSL